MKITLKAARTNKNLTLKEASKLLNVDASTIVSWEMGRTFPRADKMGVICSTYGVKYDDIDWNGANFLPGVTL